MIIDKQIEKEAKIVQEFYDQQTNALERMGTLKD